MRNLHLAALRADFVRAIPATKADLSRLTHASYPTVLKWMNEGAPIQRRYAERLLTSWPAFPLYAPGEVPLPHDKTHPLVKRRRRWLFSIPFMNTELFAGVVLASPATVRCWLNRPSMPGPVHEKRIRRGYPDFPFRLGEPIDPTLPRPKIRPTKTVLERQAYMKEKKLDYEFIGALTNIEWPLVARLFEQERILNAWHRHLIMERFIDFPINREGGLLDDYSLPISMRPPIPEMTEDERDYIAARTLDPSLW